MSIEAKEYKDHVLFKQVKDYVEFYEDLSQSVFRFISTGTTTPFNIDTYVFTSNSGTLESIHDILIKGRINDAFSLLRKYYDSIIINTYCTVYLQDNVSIENFIVAKIDNWIKGTEQLPEYRIMSNYIRSAPKLVKINDLLYKDDRYKKLRERCNDHTHYNFYHNILHNDNKIYLDSRIKYLGKFSLDLRNLFILHFAYIFYLNDIYMSSTDYVDALDCGMTPEEDSQSWVSPYIQNTFEEIVKPFRPDIAKELQSKTFMQLQ